MYKRMEKNLIFFLGLAALTLRRQLYVSAMDGKGLLIRWHPLSIALLVLTAVCLGAAVLRARKQEDSERYADNYSASFSAALGHLAMGGGILTTVLTGSPMMGGYLGLAWQWLGLAAPVCLLAAGAARMLGRKPFFLLYVVPCLFLVAHIVNHYQVWSGNPQMLDYVFALLGAMALMFFGFYSAAFCADCGSRRMAVLMGLAAVYLCLAELANSDYPALYFGGVLWVMTGMCSPRAVETTHETA